MTVKVLSMTVKALSTIVKVLSTTLRLCRRTLPTKYFPSNSYAIIVIDLGQHYHKEAFYAYNFIALTGHFLYRIETRSN